jgi:hypothetical protein
MPTTCLSTVDNITCLSTDDNIKLYQEYLSTCCAKANTHLRVWNFYYFDIITAKNA